ncbi:MAG TPA: YqaJ viral recombinase family protein [Sideroxyarcus sp.]|nr:YqaJ viral recombinase family protein [Sideroxyarcus sp.]
MTNSTVAYEPVFLGRHESGSEEWHELRAQGIGGSEVGTILGLNKWESAFTLWCKKTGRIEGNIPVSEAMEWGSRLEPVILDKWREEHVFVNCIEQPGTYCHPDHPWMIANPDAIYTDPTGDWKGIIEVKTAQFEDDWADGVPRHYEAQVQWYLQILGLEHAYVVALFHGNRYREFEVHANPLAQEAALDAASVFWACVVNDMQPDFDGSMSTYQTVRTIHPDIEDGEVELGYLGEQYFTAKAAAEKAEADVTYLKSAILREMGRAKRGLVNDVWTFTRQARNGGTPYLVEKRG